jgi:hypothetical protein
MKRIEFIQQKEGAAKTTLCVQELTQAEAA